MSDFDTNSAHSFTEGSEAKGSGRNGSTGVKPFAATDPTRMRAPTLLEAAGAVCDCAQPQGRGWFVLPEYLAELQEAVDAAEWAAKRGQASTGVEALTPRHAHQAELIPDERLLTQTQNP